jgi:hypothetical protein
MCRFAAHRQHCAWTTFGGIFSSGHFNISPEPLLEATSAG